MNIVCFKVGDKYSSEYVNKLYSMVKKNTSFYFNFICFTDDPKGIKQHQESHIDVRPLPYRGLAHWWNRMALFKKGVLSGPCIIIDLDVIIHNNIDELFEGDGFCMVPGRKFTSPVRDHYNDCVVKFDADKHNFMWDAFIDNQDLLQDLLEVDKAMTAILKLGKYEHELFPNEWFWPHDEGPDQQSKDSKFCHFIGINNGLIQHEARDNEFVKKYWI